MKQEIWKVYKESYAPRWGKRVYEVSDQGNVKINGELFDFSKYIELDKGYNRVGCFYVHRAVAELFIPNPENKPCIDHINTNKHDNRAVNLRWCTYKENCNNPLTRKYKSEVYNRPEVKAKQKASMKAIQKEVQNRPEVKAKKSASLKKIQKEAQNRPEVRAKRSASQKEVMNRPEVKAKTSAAMVDRKFLTNGIDLKFVKQELFDYYIEKGYHFGMK